ncbi:hypothetical protein AKJ09_07598 [Labilithrix luteola]|uniref:Uncharacterized protein n=1 Tax=Labilithrix luteola TaxID=1391654 RepID=A0A0K1Q696_9BACT|nr:hypothetical protein [Labilithrix luteola]AKV00935.1 hypothetical protein AKJ09_07598 [Labilithrix luteola]
MARSIPLRSLMVMGFGLGGGMALVACVDLFHTTDFGTSDCTTDPTSCAAETGSADDATSTPPKKDAAATRIDFCSSWGSNQAQARAAKACAWLGACGGPMGGSSFGACYERAALAFDCAANPGLRPAGALDDFWHCMANVDSCDASDKCVFPSGVPTCNIAGGGKLTACVDGTYGGAKAVRVECNATDSRPAAVEPCVLSGKRCGAIDDSTAECAGPTGVACTAGAPHCDGTKAVDCTGGFPALDLGIDCAEVGRGSCVMTDAGPTCMPAASAEKCAVATPFACTGNVLTGCVGGATIAIDCGKFARKCDASRATGYDPFRACYDSDGGCPAPDSCDGGVLTSCGSGGATRTDCKQVGLGACRVLPNGSAACTPP